MKSCQLVLICLVAAGQTHANSSNNLDGRTQPQASSNGAPASTHVLGITAQTAAKTDKLRHKPSTQANLAGLGGGVAKIGGGVVKEMKAGTAFVEESAAKAGTTDSWLVALAAFGLVFFQLRRKHKSLPQRRIAPYA